MHDMNLGNLGVSEAQIDLVELATNFCRDRSPIAKTRSLMTSERGYDAEIWREMVDLGWAGIAIAEAHGGVGLGLAEIVPVVEQMGRRLLASPYIATQLAAQALLVAGTEAQQAHWLPKIAGGNIASVALTEANGDWALDTPAARASEVGGGGYTLSGTKHFVLWADCADVIIASVMLGGAPRLALIERAAIGPDALRRERIIDATKRSFALTVDGIHIMPDALLDAAHTPAALTQIHLAANLLQSAEMVGGTQGVMDYTLDYLRTRKQFGKVIGEYQALKHPMADIYIGYEKARSLLYGAAHVFGQQGVGEIATRMAKAGADKIYGHAADRAVQFHGGFGFTHDCDAGLYRRGAIWNASQFGDGAWHRAKLAELLF